MEWGGGGGGRKGAFCRPASLRHHYISLRQPGKPPPASQPASPPAKPAKEKSGDALQRPSRGLSRAACRPCGRRHLLPASQLALGDLALPLLAAFSLAKGEQRDKEREEGRLGKTPLRKRKDAACAFSQIQDLPSDLDAAVGTERAASDLQALNFVAAPYLLLFSPPNLGWKGKTLKKEKAGFY